MSKFKPGDKVIIISKQYCKKLNIYRQSFIDTYDHFSKIVTIESTHSLDETQYWIKEGHEWLVADELIVGIVNNKYKKLKEAL